MRRAPCGRQGAAGEAEGLRRLLAKCVSRPDGGNVTSAGIIKSPDSITLGWTNLADGFGRYPIEDVSIDFGTGDSTFATAPTSGTVTQSVTANFSVNVVSSKFFKAEIGVLISYEPEEWW